VPEDSTVADQVRIENLRLKLHIPAVGSEQDKFYQGTIDGRRIARRYHDNSNRSEGAFLGSLAFGVVGGAVAYGTASASRPLPADPVLESISQMSSDYQQGFLSGYESQARHMNGDAALESAFWGIAIVGVVVLLVVGLSR